MLISLRTFRLTAVLMAVLLLLSGSLPLVQHVCAMASRAAPAQDHPCPRHQHDAAPSHRSMEMQGPMHAHGSMHTPPQADLPRAHETSAQAVPGACCTVDAIRGVTADGVRLLKRSMKPAVAPVVAALTDASPKRISTLSDTRFFDVRPPPEASAALHLIHSVLLN